MLIRWLVTGLIICAQQASCQTCSTSKQRSFTSCVNSAIHAEWINVENYSTAFIENQQIRYQKCFKAVGCSPPLNFTNYADGLQPLMRKSADLIRKLWVATPRAMLMCIVNDIRERFYNELQICVEAEYPSYQLPATSELPEIALPPLRMYRNNETHNNNVKYINDKLVAIIDAQQCQNHERDIIDCSNADRDNLIDACANKHICDAECKPAHKEICGTVANCTRDILSGERGIVITFMSDVSHKSSLQFLNECERRAKEEQPGYRLNRRLLAEMYGTIRPLLEDMKTFKQFTKHFLTIYDVFVDPDALCSSVDVANTRLQRNVGAPVKEGKWPWHSYVVHTEEAISCSAVLIANDVLLTAAHCLISNKWGSTFRPVDLTAFVGVVDKLNISAGRHPINVRHIEVHQKYNDENLDYDAAIVWLDQSVRPGKHVSAVRIGQRIPRDGTICFSTGFGQTNASRESSKLREIVVPYVSWDRCGQLVGGIRDSNLTKSMACAGNVTGGLDACPGDSGGPLVCQLEDNSFELQGITSWGNNTQCGEPSYTPGVYTCIPFISEWILGHPNISAQSSVLVPNRNYFCPPALHGNQSIALPNGENLEVFCDGKTDSGGWLIVERRQVDPTYLYLIIERNHLYCGSSLSKDPFEKFCISNKHLQILTANLTLELMLDIKLCDGKVFRLISDYLVFSNLDNILLTMIATAFVDFSDIVTFFNWTLVTAEYHRDKGEFNDFEQEPLGCDIPQPSNFVWYTKSKYLTRTTIWMLEVKIRPMSYLPAASTRTVIFPVDTAVSKTVGERDKRTKCSKTVSVDKRCDDRANMSKQLSDGLVYEKDFVFVCDLQTLGGGWTVIQRRYHGDTSFNRNWKDYAEGFGNGKTGEDFWIGNRLLHLLTEQRGEMEMLVELNMCDGTSLTKRYRNVRVGSEDSDFTLDSLREDGVDAANARLFAVKSPFATYEDRRGDNCVTQMGGGGWWYKSCATFLNVNGKFGCHIPYPKGNFLIDDVAKVKRRLFVNTTRIMIRRRREKSTPRTFRDRLNANMFLKFEIPFQPRSGLNFLCRNKRQHCYDLWKNHGVKTNGLQRNISLSTDIAPDGVSALFVTDLYCDMSDTLNGPGWTVIMRRTDGQESFSRDWIDYADGFGKPERDFWLGNRLLWILTSWDFFDLHLSITLCNETKVSRLYHNFGVGHELFRFPVTLDLPDGNDELWGSGGQRFYAANLGNSLRNCGNTNGGAGWWWYGTDCTNANINGPYGCEELYPANMYWRDIGGSKGDTQVIESVTMKIRPMESALKLKQLKGMQFETYKYHVLVMGRNNCSGVIVAADIVLSSARCLSPDLTNITVVPGGLANNANAPQRKVKRVAIHRAYSSGDLTYDIAIAWLYTPITSTNVSLLLNNSIPTSAPNATDNKKIVCFTPTFATPSWQNLKSKMQQHLIYQFLYYPQYEDSPSFVVELCQRQFVCTSDFDRSVYGCPGDNGAPLICWSPTTYRFELVGLSVWQNYTVCGKPTATPLVYVRLSNVYEWIRNLTGI